MTAPRFLYLGLCSALSDNECDTAWHALKTGHCKTPGKTPVSRWGEMSYWSESRPEGNAAVRCGPETGLLVVDVDTAEGALAYASWGLPDTYTVRSGRVAPAHHYYFRWPDNLLRVPDKLDGVEIKGPGRYVVAPGSRHKSGRTYDKVSSVPIATLPQSFVDRLAVSTAQIERGAAVDASPAALARLTEFLAEFPDAEELPDGNWEMVCPAHDDHDPSLVVTAGERGLLVNCRTGCSYEEIMEAIGWTASQGFAAPGLGSKASPVKLEKRQLGAHDPGTRFKASDLDKMSLGSVQWVVPDLLPDGLALLAGPPKLGKSWMVLDIALSVAMGRDVLGRPVEAGDALYLALEDNPRRLQGRMRLLLAGAPAPERLEMWTRAGTLATGVVDEIEEWIDSQPEPRLVIIDTLGRVQEGSAWVDAKDGGYADAVASLAQLQELASARHVSVVVITHTKKGGWTNGADPLEAVLGSQGYAGTADAVLVLKRERGSANGELFVTGREIEEELTESVWFDRDCCRWVVGNSEYEESEELAFMSDPALGALLLDFLEKRDEKKNEYINAYTMSGEQVALAIHRRRDDVDEALGELEGAKLVTSKPRPGRGKPGKLWGPQPLLPPALSGLSG